MSMIVSDRCELVDVGSLRPLQAALFIRQWRKRAVKSIEIRKGPRGKPTSLCFCLWL